MEGAPKIERNENIENLSDWRKLKAEAPFRAMEYIANIEGYESLSVQGKIGKLNELFAQLEASNDEKFNDERFTAQIVSLHRESLELGEQEHEIRARRAQIDVRLAA